MSVSILIVDDETDVADLFRQHFRREARNGTYVMHFANSGDEALQLLDEAIEPDPARDPFGHQHARNGAPRLPSSIPQPTFRIRSSRSSQASHYYDPSRTGAVRRILRRR